MLHPRADAVRHWIQTTDFGVELPLVAQILEALTGFKVEVRRGEILKYASYQESDLTTLFFSTVLSGFLG